MTDTTRQTIVVQKTPVRNWLLLTFLFAVVAVVVVDRYLTTDSCRLAMDANEYNIRETLRIIEVGKAQQRDELILKALVNADDTIRAQALTVARQQLQIERLQKLLQQKGVEVPPPGRWPGSFNPDKDA
jgi:hypothetical protein